MSWFDEAEELLAKKKKDQEEYQKAVARYWSKFTPRAHKVFSFAIKEAREMKLSFVGVELLLVALLALGTDVGINAVRNQGLTVEAVRAEILKLNGGVPKDVENPPYYLHTTPRLKHVFEAAKKEAMALHHTYVGTDHLLLALLAEKEGVAHRIFKTANIEPAAMRNEILSKIVPGENPPKDEDGGSQKPS